MIEWMKVRNVTNFFSLCMKTTEGKIEKQNISRVACVALVISSSSVLVKAHKDLKYHCLPVGNVPLPRRRIQHKTSSSAWCHSLIPGLRLTSLLKHYCCYYGLAEEQENIAASGGCAPQDCQACCAVAGYTDSYAVRSKDNRGAKGNKITKHVVAQDFNFKASVLLTRGHVTSG